MCGIAGILGGSADHDRLRSLTGRMVDRLVHRGPDSEGLWIDAPAGIALGHRRLAIIDRSPAGAQPMLSRCKRYVITYNGEIYNYRELASDVSPQGHCSSDTAVLLDCLSAWGLERTLPRLNGMFAMGVWDRLTRTLSLVTDRLGEKPLYYAVIGADLVFASELKALTTHDGFAGDIDEHALGAFMRTGYVPAPRTIYRAVSKLEGGSVVTYRRRGSVEARRYWAPPTPGLVSGSARPAAALERLDALLDDSIRLRLRADVPVGVFFSGGVDSATILSRTRKLGTSPVTAFTVAFEEEAFNEAGHARAIAQHLDCDHVQATLRADDALALIPELPAVYDEPFGDASAVAACLLSSSAKPHITVALAGEGADELFGGYLRYHWARELWPLWSASPRAVRTGIARHLLDVASRAASVVPQTSRLATRLGRIAQSLAAGETRSLNRYLTAQPDGEQLLAHSTSVEVTRELRPSSADELVEQLMWLDLADYLPNDILVKTDRASMASAVEVRLPFLDHRLVEWAVALPAGLRDGKRLLKRLLARDVPAELIDRPKQGFALPIAQWLRGPLRPWAEDLLAMPRLRQHAFLDAAAARRQWSEHLAGRRDWRHSLWPLLMFLAWDRSTTAARTSPGLHHAAVTVRAASS